MRNARVLAPHMRDRWPPHEIPALIPADRGTYRRLTSHEAVAVHLSQHPQVQSARRALEAAAAEVFREPRRAVEFVMQHRYPTPRDIPQPLDRDLLGRRTQMGNDKARAAAYIALPAFYGAARVVQSIISTALAELRERAEQRAQHDLIPVPAPSAVLANALATRSPREIADDADLMAEVRTIQNAIYQRYGRSNAAILAIGSQKCAADLLPEDLDLEELRLVLLPLHNAVLAKQDLAHERAKAQKHPMTARTRGAADDSPSRRSAT